MEGVAPATTLAPVPPIARAAVGPVVHVAPRHFLQLLGRSPGAVVLHAPAGFLRPHRYLTAYRGLYLLTRDSLPIELPREAEVIAVKRLRMPA